MREAGTAVATPQVQLAADKYAILRELLNFMTPLFVVAERSSNALNAHYVALPPDESIGDILLPNGRVLQAGVRSHVFHGSSSRSLVSLSGHEASFVAEPPVTTISFSQGTGDETDGSAELPRDTLPTKGTLSVHSGQGAPIVANVLAIIKTSNEHFSFLVVDRSVYATTSITRRSVASMKTFGVAGVQPIWQRIPCSATGHIRRAQASLISTDELYDDFLSDERSFRRVVVEMIDDKEDEISLQRASVCSSSAPRASGHGRCSSQIFGNKCSTHFSLRRLHDALDRAMLQADTEVQMFLSAYVMVPGFEYFILSKVLQIVESITDIALGLTADGTSHGGMEEESDVDDCDVELERHSEPSNSTQSIWTDEEGEQMLVAFHTIVGGALAHKIVPHWEELGYNEDFAFSHACATLRERVPTKELCAGLCADITMADCLQVIELVRLIDKKAMSVFSYMRVMECTITCAIGVIHRLAARGCEVTADICIPLVVLVLVFAAPTTLPSKIRYLLDFSVPVLDMSSLGYALTTFEAATAQLLDEYRQRVIMMD